MRRNTSLSSVGRAPDCSCVKTNVSADIRVSPVQVWERGPHLQRISLAWSTLYREVERFQSYPLSWERGPVLTIVQVVLISFCQPRDAMKRSHLRRYPHTPPPLMDSKLSYFRSKSNKFFIYAGHSFQNSGQVYPCGRLFPSVARTMLVLGQKFTIREMLYLMIL